MENATGKLNDAYDKKEKDGREERKEIKIRSRVNVEKQKGKKMQ